ncbi:hypothetical protein ACJJTC_014830 [Scirpophaga incertulas]
MVTFSKAINYCYNKLDSAKLMSPLCGAIFSRDSLGDMAKELNMEEVRVLEIINESSTSGGQYLPSSDIACAIVCMICTTKRVTDKNIRNTMISKVVKQYIHKQKVYNNHHFKVFARHKDVSVRAKAMAIKQSEISLRPHLQHQVSQQQATDSTQTRPGTSGASAYAPPSPKKPPKTQ